MKIHWQQTAMRISTQGHKKNNLACLHDMGMHIHSNGCAELA
jgi:hypothetical protein